MVQPLGNLFIIAAPSGAGKSSLINALLPLSDTPALNQVAQLSVSHTTRHAREGEVDGKHYHFTTPQAFETLIDQDAFYEHAKVFGNYYGTSKAAITDKLQQGINVFLDIDWQGARQIKAVNPDVVSVFILPPSVEELRTRLVGRGQDSPEVIEKRMQQAVSEISHFDEFDYLIVNDDFDEALRALVNLVNSQSLRTEMQSLRYESLIKGLLGR